MFDAFCALGSNLDCGNGDGIFLSLVIKVKGGIFQ